MSWRSDRGGKRLSLDSGVSLGCPGLSLAWEVVTCQHNTQQWRKKAMITLLLIKYYNWNLKTRFGILNGTVPSLILFSERGSSSRRSTSTEMAESPRRSSSGPDSLESESDWNFFCSGCMKDEAFVLLLQRFSGEDIWGVRQWDHLEKLTVCKISFNKFFSCLIKLNQM